MLSLSHSVHDTYVKSWQFHATWSLRDVKGNSHLVQKKKKCMQQGGGFQWYALFLGSNAVRWRIFPKVEAICSYIKSDCTGWSAIGSVHRWTCPSWGHPPLLPRRVGGGPRGTGTGEGAHAALKMGIQQQTWCSTFSVLSKASVLHSTKLHLASVKPPQPRQQRWQEEPKAEMAGESCENRAEKQIQTFWLAPRVTWTDAFLSQRA